MSTIVLRIALLPTFLVIAASLTSCDQETPYEREVQCRKTCGERGKYGALEQRPRPASPKAPLAIEYECTCF